MELRGIDVSSRQGRIDWKKVKGSGVQFAILRCHQRFGIDEDNFTVTADMIHYLRPLTEGETKVDYKEGLPDYLYDRY